MSAANCRSLENTLEALELIQNCVDAKAMVSLGGGYAFCTVESGPILQRLGDGYFVKRGPNVVKLALQDKLKREIESCCENSSYIPTETAAEPENDGFPQEDIFEIVERYESSDEDGDSTKP